MNNDFLKKVEDMISKLDSSSYKELLDDIALSDLKDAYNSFSNGISRLESEDKTLTIGIVGQVKAGKSSFLNALFFEGEDILPKAVTPMTAALTKIRYSKDNYAKVHFFSKQDWENIKEGAEKAKSLIDQKREDINQKAREKGKEPTNKSDMEILKFMDNVSDSNKSFFEMYELFKKNAGKLESKLIDSDDNCETLNNISSINDLKDRLEDYVGANGLYTSIVKYVELFLNIEAIKDFDIVDTPGLNDPVISRGNLTRTFLSECDAVFLLSQSSQFFDSQDCSLFSEQLPQNSASNSSSDTENQNQNTSENDSQSQPDEQSEQSTQSDSQNSTDTQTDTQNTPENKTNTSQQSAESDSQNNPESSENTTPQSTQETPKNAQNESTQVPAEEIQNQPTTDQETQQLFNRIQEDPSRLLRNRLYQQYRRQP